MDEQIIVWSNATAQSMIDFEPDVLFQDATAEFENALRRAIKKARGSDGAVIHIKIEAD